MKKSLLITLVVCSSAPAWAKSTVITAFQPQNLVDTTNQIRAVFSDKMVALSVNPDANIFTINCSPAMTGTAQWVDEKTWEFDFQTKLDGNKIPGGTRCTVALNAGVKNFAGVAVAGKTAYKFQIDGPNIISMYPGDPTGVSKATVLEDQIFAIGLDAEVDTASVLKNVYFKVDGIASPVQIRILDAAETKTVMATQTFQEQGFDASMPLLLLKATQPFPDNRKISLVWGQGVTSKASGLARQRSLIVAFESRPMLAATFTCTRENAKADCSPFSDLEVDFTADIPASMAKQIRMVSSDGKVVYATLNKGDETVTNVTFPATVRENQSYKLEIPSGIKDESGRPLANAASFPLTIKTSDFPPLAKFSADFGIIEANVAPVLLPATLRNLEAQVAGQKLSPSLQGSSVRLSANNFPAVVQWMKTLDIKNTRAADFKDRNHSVFTDNRIGTPSSFKIPLSANGKAFEVVGIPLSGPGFYVVELQSKVLGNSLLGNNATMYVPTGALVTNMVVHAKWGKANSLFWVTALDSGATVSGAQVSVYDCTGKAVGQPLTTDQNGIATITGDLQQQINLNACNSDGAANNALKKGKKAKAAAAKDQGDDVTPSKYDSGFFVSAQKGNDFTFTHSQWTDGIEYWRFGNINDPNPQYSDDGTIAHSVLDRTLFRAGETVSMKHFIRVQSLMGLSLMKAAQLPSQVWIDLNDTHYTADLKWDSNGIATSQFVIPKDAKLGMYTVTLAQANGTRVGGSYATANFQVMEFKIPQMKGLIAFPNRTQQLVQPGKLDTQVSVNYQNGGPVANQPVTFRYTIGRGYGTYFDAFPNMGFAGDRVVAKQGRAQDGQEQNETTVQVPLRLDSNGSALYSVPGLSGLDSAKVVTTQLEFVDSNQEAQDVTRTINIYPSAQLVAVSADNGFSSDVNLKFNVAIVDLKGNPIVGAVPTLELFEQITYTHKTKMVGGYYSSESFTDTNPVTATFKCQGKTDSTGIVNCSTTAPQSGTYIVQATTQDPAGNSSYGSDSFYVRGKRRAWFPSDNNDRMDLIPANRQVRSGQNAAFQVKMPFAQATVLVTVEREGVLDSFVTTVSTQNPVINVKIKPEYAPNVFVSALAVRGRVSGAGIPDETATIDLGKPAYKLGLTSLNVDWSPHTLTVNIKPSKDTYKPRETASVAVTITDSAGNPVPNAEFAMAVVDKGLLDLSKNRTWDLLSDMMSKRNLTVQTSTAQMQVIGKRHYGLKAKPTGGDGGAAPTRELFDTLVKWFDRVQTDANGQATVTFPMNDSLTAFAIAAIASAGVDKFGTGEYTITTQQDVIIEPGLAQTARNGDNSDTAFTVRNTTKAPMSVTLTGRVKVTYADGSTKYFDLAPQTMNLAAQGSQQTSLGTFAMPDGAVQAEFQVSAKDGSNSVVDSMNITQTVNPSVLVRTWMAQLSRIDANLQPVNVSLPTSALPNQGGVQVSMMSSLIGGLETVNSNLLLYPFMSLEYLVSRAVATQDQTSWDAAMARLPSYLDSEGLALYYPSTSSGQGSDVLTAYILSMSKYSGFVIPQATRDQMVQGLSGFVAGTSRAAKAPGQTAVDTYIRRVNAIEVLARMGVAEAAWMSALPAVTMQQTPTTTLINLLSIYDTLKKVPQALTKSDQVQSELRLRLTRLGTGLKFSADGLTPWYAMTSTNADQLRLILVLSSNADLATTWASDVPNLVVAAAQMMSHGAWDLTVADAYGVLAMRAYSKKFEPQTVTGVTQVTFNSGTPSPFNWGTSPNGGMLDFGWPGAGTYNVAFNHQGTGTPWTIVAVNAAVPITQKVEKGINVTKTLSPVKTVYNVGDEITVTLNIKAQAALANVSLVDPIPAGSKIEGSGLDNDGNEGPSGMYPDYQELANDGYHASYGMIPNSSFTVSYKIRLNNAGTYKLPSTRVEAIYAPENFSELPNADITVQP